jgi:hypothetical protein
MKKSMRNTIQTLVLGSLFWASTGLATGGIGSGGGNALVCFDSSSIPDAIRSQGGFLSDEYVPLIKSIETYDLYEAKLPRGADPHPVRLATIGNDESISEFLWYIMRRVERVAPDVAFETVGAADLGNLFPAKNVIHLNHGLTKIDDVNSAEPIDPKCVLVTVARQVKENQQYFMYIDDRLFGHPLHARESQAALILHEYVYRFARDQGQTDARNTRALVGMMLIEDERVSVMDFIQQAYKLGFLPKYSEETLAQASSFDLEIKFAAENLLNELIYEASPTPKTIQKLMGEYDNLYAPRITQFAPYLSLNGHDGARIARDHVQQILSNYLETQILPTDVMNGLNNVVLTNPMPFMEAHY